MREIRRYQQWQPETPVYDSALLGQCQSRSQLFVGPRPPMITDCLTPRRHEALFYIAQGETNAQVANLMGISTNTVKINFQNILLALDAQSRVEASLKGVAIGALPLDQLVEPGEQMLMRELKGKAVDILDLMIKDYGRRAHNQGLAQALCVSPDTVKNYTQGIMQRMDIHDRTRLAVIRYSLDH